MESIMAIVYYNINIIQTKWSSSALFLIIYYFNFKPYRNFIMYHKY